MNQGGINANPDGFKTGLFYDRKAYGGKDRFLNQGKNY